ncbi:MAG: TonB-dependent receptor [Oceanococcaceae bacterium]
MGLALIVCINSGHAQPPSASPRDNDIDTIPLPTEPPPDLGPGPQAPTALDAVVVTATPSDDSTNEVPISVNVTSEADLRLTNITDVESLSDRLPNAQLALTPTNTFLFVRGLGTGSVRSAEQSVGFFVDGVFLGRPQVALFDFLDLDQVELLRGPQGAILGKNTVAGAVNVVTAPPTRRTEGYLDVLTGSDEQLRGRGALSGALTDTLSGRIAYSETDEDGYLFNTTQQREDLARPGRGGRAKLRWEPTGNQSYTLTAQSARIRQVGDSFELSQASDTVLNLFQLFDEQTRTDITDRRTHTDHDPSGALIEGDDLLFNADWRAEFGRLRFAGGSSRQDVIADLDLDISPVPLLTLPSVERYRQHSGELRFDTDVPWGGFGLGAFYFDSELDLDVDITLFDQGVAAVAAPLANNLAGVPVGDSLLNLISVLEPVLQPLGALPLPDLIRLGRGSSQHRLVQDQRTLAVFGSLYWDLTDRHRIRFDGRYTRETKDANQGITFDGVSGPLLGAALGEEEYQLLSQREETDFSPRLSWVTTWQPTLTSYVTVAQGFKSGGFNNLAATPERAEFDGEESLTVEAGLRWRSGSAFRADVGLFRTDFDNLQVAALDGTEFFVGNAARAYTQGIEVTAQWAPWPWFQVGADLGYLDARYDEYRNAPARADDDADSQDLSGRVLQRAPKFSGSIRAGVLSFLPYLGWPLALGAVAEGASRQFLNIDLDPIDSQPGFLRYNAFASVSSPDERVTLRVIGRNLSDKIVRREAADIALIGAHSVGTFPPRSIAVELGLRFQ